MNQTWKRLLCNKKERITCIDPRVTEICRPKANLKVQNTSKQTKKFTQLLFVEKRVCQHGSSFKVLEGISWMSLKLSLSTWCELDRKEFKMLPDLELLRNGLRNKETSS